MYLGGLRASQAKTVNCTGAHVRLGEEDVRAIGILLVVSAHIHSASQCEDFLGKETFAKCWHPLVTIEAYSLALVLNRAHCDIELRILHVKDLSDIQAVQGLSAELLLKIDGLLYFIAASLRKAFTFILFCNLVALDNPENPLL